jgi:hypothetical protein
LAFRPAYRGKKTVGGQDVSRRLGQLWVVSSMDRRNKSEGLVIRDQDTGTIAVLVVADLQGKTAGGQDVNRIHGQLRGVTSMDGRKRVGRAVQEEISTIAVLGEEVEVAMVVIVKVIVLKSSYKQIGTIINMTEPW